MILLICESKKCNKLVNKTKRSRLTDIENKLVVISGDREVGGAVRGVGDIFFKKELLWNYTKLCV